MFSPAATGMPLVLLNSARPLKFSGGHSGSSSHFKPTALSCSAIGRASFNVQGQVDVERQLDVWTRFLAGRADRGKLDFMKLERAEPRIDCSPHAGSDQRGIR